MKLNPNQRFEDYGRTKPLPRISALWVTGLVALALLANATVTRAGDPDPLEENKALFLTDELDVATVRYELLRRERKELFGVYYLWDGDRIGAAALSSYLEAAKNGAKVRIVIDGFSALQSKKLPKGIKKLMEPIAPSATISTAMMKALLDEGVEIRIFNPLRPGNIKSVIPPLLNTRTHEKFTYFRGQRTAIVGDRNWQAVNFRAKKVKDAVSNSSYRSAEVVFSGKNTDQVAEYMEQLWADSNLVKKPNLKDIPASEVQAEKNRLRRLQAGVQEWTAKREELAEDLFAQMKSVKNLKFVRDTPSHKRTMVGMDEDIIRALSEAEESITLVSPYIVFTPRYRKIIRERRAKGVTIRIITPAMSTTDAPLASAAFELQARELVQEGVEIYHHLGPDFLHAKMFLVDGKTAGVLTHNFDLLSEYLNYESGVIAEDPDFAASVAEFMDYIMKTESRPYTRTHLKASMFCLGHLMKFITEHPPFRKLKYSSQ